MKTQKQSIYGCLLTSRPNIQRDHDQFIYELFMRKFRFDFNKPELKYDQKYFEKNLYFITMHFRPNLFTAKDANSLYNSGPMFESFKHWYLKALSSVMGAKMNKHIKLQPFALACLDVEGTAYGATASVFQIPHIHACLLVHPENQDGFESHLLSLEAKQFRDNNISEIDIRQFRDDSRGIQPMLTYASKYAREQQSSPRHTMLMEAYPDVEAKKYPFYRA